MILDFQPDLSVVIINWNTKALLRQCLESIYQTKGDSIIEIIVFDNGSVDGSIELVREVFPDVRLIEGKENLGFARANNLAIQQARGKYLFLLNSDTVVQPGAIQNVIARFKDSSKIGAMGSHLRNRDGSSQPSFGDFPTIWSEFLFQSYLYKLIPPRFPYGRKVHPLRKSSYLHFQEVDWVPFAAVGIPMSTIMEVGELDEQLFMYGEDLDWCWRAKTRGYHVVYSPEVSVTHLISASRSNYADWIENYTKSNLFFFYVRRSFISHKLTCILVIAGSLLRILLSACLWIISKKRRKEASQRLGGYWKAYSFAQRALLKPATVFGKASE